MTRQLSVPLFHPSWRDVARIVISDLEFYHRYTGKSRDLFDLCVRHNIILKEKNCESCGKPALLDFNKKKWRCQKTSRRNKKVVKCAFSQSVFKNTFLEKVHLDIDIG